MLTSAIFIGFILLQLLVGVVISRFIKTGDDYFVAGRKQGPLIVTFSIFATWFGSESCLGTAGRVYENGLLGSRADPFGYTICLLIYGFLLVRHLWSKEIVTIGDVIGKRFGPTAETLAGLILAITSLLWASGQVRAFGHILSLHLSMNLTLAVVLATSVAVIYTAFGGLLADAYTDLLQGIILIIGLIVLFYVVVFQESDESTLSILKNLPMNRTRLFASQSSLLENIDAWLVPIAGALVSQELVARVSGARTQKIATTSAIIAGILYLIVGLIPLVLGLLAPSLLGHVANSDETLILLANKYLPTTLNLLFSAGLVSAILSTVDSAFLAGSASLTRNVASRFVTLTSERQLKLGRLFVVLMGIAACILGLSSENIYNLVIAAASFGTAGVLILFLIGLFTKIGHSLTGVLTLLTGLITTIIFDHLHPIPAPYVWSMLSSLFCFCSVEAMMQSRVYFRKRRMVTAYDSLSENRVE